MSARVCFPVSGERQDGLFTLNGSQPKLVLELLEDGTVISSASGKGAVCLGAAVVEPPPKGTEVSVLVLSISDKLGLQSQKYIWLTSTSVDDVYVYRLFLSALVIIHFNCLAS